MIRPHIQLSGHHIVTANVVNTILLMAHGFAKSIGAMITTCARGSILANIVINIFKLYGERITQ